MSIPMTAALGRFALRATSVVSFALMLLPIFFVSWLSFFKNEILSFPPQGYTLRWFSQLWLQPQFADRWRTLIRITLPVIRPAVVAAALFSFVVSFGNLEISLFLVGPGETTLPIAILQYLEWKIDPTVAAISLIQIVIVAGGMLVTNRFVRLSQVV